MNDHDKIIRSLAEMLNEDFAEFVAGHEAVHDLVMELASEYVGEKMTMVKEEDQTDVAMELMMGVTVRAV